MDEETIHKLDTLNWSTECFNIEKIEEKFGFPIIAKISSKSISDYQLSEPVYVLLHGKKCITRLVAQTIETGHYVVGKQIEIPTGCNFIFKISEKFERPGFPVKNFRSVEEIASCLPPIVYIQQNLAVCPEGSNEDQIILQTGDEFTVLGHNEEAVKSNRFKPTNHLRVLNKKKVLNVYCKRLNLNISLPYNTRAQFSTRSATEMNFFQRNVDMNACELLNSIDFPCTVVVKQNRSSSLPYHSNEVHLKGGSCLKIIGAERHRFILGLTSSNKFIEFSTSLSFFHLPTAITNLKMNENEDRKFQALFQEICSSPEASNSSIDSYLQSARVHLPRSIRPTKPRPMASNLIQRLREDQHRSASVNTTGIRVAKLRSQFTSESAVNEDSSGGPPLPPRNVTAPLIPASSRRPRNVEKPLPPVPTSDSERSRIDEEPIFAEYQGNRQKETSRRHDNEAPQLEDLIPRPLLITNEIDEDQEDENIYSVKNQETGISSNADNRIESSLSKSLYSLPLKADSSLNIVKMENDAQEIIHLQQIRQMSVEEVSKSLKFIGMNEDLIEAFQQECVDGKLLLTLTSEILKVHFKMSIFHQHKLIQFIYGWRPKRNSSS